MDIIKTSVVEQRGMTIRGHLFLSSLLHAVFVFFLLSLPLYRGSINFESFGFYSVDLVKGVGENPSSTVLPVEVAQSKRVADKANAGAVVEKDNEEREQPRGEEKMVVPEEKMELIAKKASEEKKASSVEKQVLRPKEISEEKAARTVHVEETVKRTEMVMAVKKEELAPQEIEEVVKEEPEVKVSPPKEVVVNEPPRTEAVKPAAEPVPETKPLVKETVKPLEVSGGKRPPPEEKEEKAAPAVETPEKPKEPAAEKKTDQALKTAAEKKEKGKEARDKRPPQSGRVVKASKSKTHSLKGNEKRASKAEFTGIRRLAAKDLNKSAVISSKGSPEPKKSGETGKGPLPSANKDQGAAPVAKSVPAASPGMNGRGEKAPPKNEGSHSAGAAEAEKFAIASQGPVHNGQEGTRPPARVEAKSDTGQEIKPPLGIPVPDILLRKDIKIEIIFRDAGKKGMLSRLLKKTHPSARGKRAPEKPKGVEGVEEREENVDPGSPGAGTMRVLSVVKADRGLYILVLENNSGETLSPDIVFHIFEGKPGERTREIKQVELAPHAVIKFKLILPEAVFWDDESYFTGTIESSDILTKFNDKTKLIWKEEKDY